MHFREVDGAWLPHAIVQLQIEAGRITRVRDDVHVAYLLQSSAIEA